MFNHTFAICAYKESPYLEECIKSILCQRLKTNCIICTSTPNPHISSLANKYNLVLYTRKRKPDENSIAEDWNFAFSKVETDYCTLAHQDDIYINNYSLTVFEALKNSSLPLIIFSNYAELRESQKTFNSLILKIKRLMQKPFKSKLFSKSKTIRKLLLSFGNPICCPSICLSKKNLDETVFSSELKCSIDWLAWSNISNYDGDFVYINKPLILHRIHKESETTNLVNQNIRQQEDYYMFCKFWWKPIAKILSRLYSYSLKSNQV